MTGVKSENGQGEIFDMVAKLKSVGLDWVRLTTPSPSIGEIWLQYVKRILGDEATGMPLAKRAKRLGYAGVMGSQVFWGQRDDGYMIDMSSDMARELGLLFMSRGGKATRLDLQCTFDCGDQRKHLIENAFYSGCSHKYGRGREPDIEMRTGRLGARSVTVGKRSSEQYGRMYDKEEESGEERYKGCVRLEVEFKDRAAILIQSSIRETDAQIDRIQELTEGWWRRHGIMIEHAESMAGEMIPFKRPPTTLESKRAWLRSQVAPTVSRVVNVIGVIPLIEDIVEYGQEDKWQVILRTEKPEV